MIEDYVKTHLTAPCDSCEGTGVWMHIGERDIFTHECKVCGGTGWFIPPIEGMTPRMFIALQTNYIEHLEATIEMLQQENNKLKGVLEWRQG